MCRCFLSALVEIRALGRHRQWDAAASFRSPWIAGCRCLAQPRRAASLVRGRAPAGTALFFCFSPLMGNGKTWLSVTAQAKIHLIVSYSPWVGRDLKAHPLHGQGHPPWTRLPKAPQLHHFRRQHSIPPAAPREFLHLCFQAEDISGK